MKTQFEPIAIRPVPLLAELRDRVFMQSEKRSPKWKFRLAPDLVAQIQPKLTTALLKFECRALQCADANAARLVREEQIAGEDYWWARFNLLATVPEQWLLKPTYYTWKRGADCQGAYGIPGRMAAALEDGHFDRLRPALMLGHNCMICGKGLTDPVSMARFIGPECAGTASPDLPFAIDLDAA